jgi:hypothetical protein
VAAGVAAAAAGIARIDVGAQGGGGSAAVYTAGARAQAPVDLAGVWASAITELAVADDHAGRNFIAVP